ncbi:hypothetical protein [uncultured Brevibacterium sp.]|uniref:SCO6745 family protein n=1 Tax=uncultured Brevibacterium sp. TaxID=189678 RepID=UPI0025CD545A|nr:hypothetical protein [uncultured Brevibacterium sp.]
MVNSQRRDLIRRLSKRVESVHSATYFARPVGEAIAGTGVTHPSAIYFAGRAAPLGRVPASVVAATFYSFNPAYIRRFVPECWDTAAPETVHAARLAGVEQFLAGAFGPEAPGGRSPELPALAQHLVDALDPVLTALLPDGRTLFAAHQEALAPGVQAQDPAVQPFLDLWSAATLLREYRGDGHIGALVTHDLSGLEAIVLHCLTGTSFRPAAARKSRGWSEEEWNAAVESLRERGLVLGAGDEARITDEAAALREEIEQATDASVALSWEALSDERLAELDGQAKDFAKILVAQDAFPQKLFAAGSGLTSREQADRA